MPSAIVAHSLDQPFHMRRLHDLGVGPGGFRRSRLTERRLAGLLVDLTQGPRAAGYAARAREVGVIVRAEDGVGTALDAMARLGLLDA